MLLSCRYTFLCRIDTLDSRQNLKPCVVGYSVLKMCIDGNKTQSKTTQDVAITDNILLNSGRFKLPIFLGGLPKTMFSGGQHEVFDESTVQLCFGDCAFPGAYLYVRMYDPTVDMPKKFTQPENNSKHSVAMSLLSMLPFVGANVPPPPEIANNKTIFSAYLAKCGKVDNVK